MNGQKLSTFASKLKVKGLDICYSTAYVSQTQEQQCWKLRLLKLR